MSMDQNNSQLRNRIKSFDFQHRRHGFYRVFYFVVLRKTIVALEHGRAGANLLVQV